MKQSITREKWLDISKGIAKIAIVFGHSGELFISKFLYWFHVPAFMILSGYLFNPVSDLNQLKSLAKKRFIQLFVPYITLIFLITIVRYIILFTNESGVNLQFVMFDLTKVIFSSELGGKYYGTLWFLPCLFFTQIGFATVCLIFKKGYQRMMVVLALFVVAHFESHYALSHTVYAPLNIDKMLMTLTYFAFGYYAKSLLAIRSINLAIVSSTITLSLIILGYLGYLNYELDLAAVTYNNLLLDFLIPTIMTTTLCLLSKFIADFKISYVFSVIGINSLTIMYLHKNPNYILRNFFDYGPVIYLIIGIIVPLALTVLIINKFKVTKFLFKGITFNITIPTKQIHSTQSL